MKYIAITLLVIIAAVVTGRFAGEYFLDHII